MTPTQRILPVCILLAPGIALAASESYEDFFPHPATTSPVKSYLDGTLEFTDWGTNGSGSSKYKNVTFDLPKFDPRKGVLTSVTLELEATAKGYGHLQNNVDYTTTIQVIQTVDVTLDTSAVPELGGNVLISHRNEEELIDVAVGETAYITDFLETKTKDLIISDPSKFASFIDDEPGNPFTNHFISFPVIADGDVKLGQNTGNMVNEVQTLAGGRASVKYGYIGDGDLQADIDWTGNGGFWIGTTITESCANYGFTLEFSCDQGASFNTNGYSLPAGCAASPDLSSNPFNVTCTSDQPLTNDPNAAHQQYAFPSPQGSNGQCAVKLLEVKCNGTNVNNNDLFDGDSGGSDTSSVALPVRAPALGSAPTPIPTLGGIGLLLLSGLLGLVGIRRRLF